MLLVQKPGFLAPKEVYLLFLLVQELLPQIFCLAVLVKVLLVGFFKIIN